MERTMMEARAGEALAEEQAKQEERARKEKEAREAVEAELARRAPSATDCGICCKSYADIAVASSSSSAAGALTAVLPCCHTVCHACVRLCAQRRSVACPVCLARFDGINSNEQVNGLPRNPFVEDAVLATVHTQCSECKAAGVEADEDSRATNECSTSGCNAVLCHGHALVHGRMPQSRGHVVTPMATHAVAVDLCKTHGKALDTYCIDCKAVVCLACILKNGGHPTPAHHTVLLTEYLPQILAELDKAKKDANRRQVEGVSQLVAIRTTEAAADERGAALTSEVKRSFAVMVGTLQRRETAMLEEVAKLTREERAALEAAAGAEQLHWTALQGGTSLTEQLLATGTAPVRVGQLAHTASAHLVAAAGKSVGPAPSLEEIQLFVDPSVQKVLETMGKLQYVRAYGPKCTVAGDGVRAARIGKTATFIVTAISRSNERVQVGGDRVEARLHAGNDVTGAVCAAEDAGIGTYKVTYTASGLGPHQLHICVNGNAVAGSPFTVAVARATFEWGGSAEYDNRGIIYHLATAGGTRPWTNPHDAGVVVVTAQGSVTGNLRDFVNNAVGRLYVGGTPNVWLAVDLNGRKVVPSGYMLSTRHGFHTNLPRSWNFEGSNDGLTWTLLKAHANNQTFNAKTWTAYWPVPATSDNKEFSHFRVVLTGKDSADSDYLAASCIELYGELLDD